MITVSQINRAIDGNHNKMNSIYLDGRSISLVLQETYWALPNDPYSMIGPKHIPNFTMEADLYKENKLYRRFIDEEIYERSHL